MNSTMSESTSAPQSPAPDSSRKFKEIPLSGLDPRLQKQVTAADQAIERDPQYAIEVCSNILANNPGALDVRKILRKAQRRAVGAKSKGFAGLMKLTNTPFVMKANSLIKTDPKAALESAEKMLGTNPQNVPAMKLIGQAAGAMGLWKTAVFAYENIRDLEPENIANLLDLGNAHVEAGEAREAVKCGEMILDSSPANGEAQALLRRASVAITMDKGKWDEQSDFRQKLANTEQAVALEQQSRMVNDADTLTILVGQAVEKIAKDPENINLYRDVIGYLKQLQKYDEALDWVRKARQQPLGKADGTLEKLESDFVIAQMMHTIAQLEEKLAQGPDADMQAQLNKLRKDEAEFRLHQSKTLVEKYPNDYAFRFEYGKLLFGAGQLDQAIRELQLARRNPKVAHHAMLFLGRSYGSKGILDLAEEQLEQAKKEMALMNDLKKEIIYELAQVYRKHNKSDKAIEEFKVLYATDIDYKDVSQIINEYYEKRAQG
jgi:tetratricopeptide (TPR) repeat protein